MLCEGCGSGLRRRLVGRSPQCRVRSGFGRVEQRQPVQDLTEVGRSDDGDAVAGVEVSVVVAGSHNRVSKPGMFGCAHGGGDRIRRAGAQGAVESEFGEDTM